MLSTSASRKSLHCTSRHGASAKRKIKREQKLCSETEPRRRRNKRDKLKWKKKEIYNWQWRSTWERCGWWFLRCAFGDGFAWILKCVDSQCGTLMAALVSCWDGMWTVGARDGFLSSRRWPCWDGMWLTRCGRDLKASASSWKRRKTWFMRFGTVNKLCCDYEWKILSQSDNGKLWKMQKGGHAIDDATVKIPFERIKLKVFNLIRKMSLKVSGLRSHSIETWVQFWSKTNFQTRPETFQCHPQITFNDTTK